MSVTDPIAAEDAGSERPNILVILADDLGYGDLECCGAPDMRTPHLNRLFADGMRFTEFYATCPVCSPTRASLLTGRHHDTVGVQGVIRTHPENSWGYLDPDCRLLPDVARESGYDTAIIGKWHLGLKSPNRPTDRGFRVFRGFLGDMMDDYYHHRRHGINYMRDGLQEIDPKGHATTLFTDWACDYIRSAAKDSRPFLLYLAYNAPHTPIQPPEEWLDIVRERQPETDEPRARLVALIEHMDFGIGRVRAALTESGQAENTLIVFTSDNGGQLNVGANNGPLRDGKQSVYEGGLKVPTCVVWPGHINAQTQTRFRATSMDILPTAFQAAGVVIPHAVDGRSFLPSLLGQEQPVLREELYFSRREGGLRYGGKTIQAIQFDGWKLLQNSPFEPLQLFHLAKDPAEESDVAASNPKIVNQLNGRLRKHLQRGGKVPWQAP